VAVQQYWDAYKTVAKKTLAIIPGISSKTAGKVIFHAAG